MWKYGKEVNECLLRLQKGDMTALGELFELSANHLLTVVHRFVQDKNNCEDAVLETFLRVIQYVKTFDPEQDGFNWMCTIARREAYKIMRTESSYVGLEDISPVRASVDGGLSSVLDRLELTMATQHLDESSKRILYLRYYVGKTLEEIAQETDMSKAGVYKRIEYIKKEIAAYLKRK